MTRIRWWEPLFGSTEAAAVAEVIKTGFVNDGPVTRELERRFAGLCDMPYAVATTSGTTALFLTMAALGVKRDDEVIVPNVSFIATANAVSLIGARPVLVDVSLRSGCVDPSAVDASITAKTRAIVAVHVSGRAADMSRIVEVARQRRIPVIEDAAEALGSRCALGPLGGLAEAGCFSLTANKTITSGQGGMIVVRDEETYWRLRELKDQGRRQRGTGGDDLHPVIGYNFKFTDIQAAVALAQFDTLPWRLGRLRRIYEIYRENLEGCRRVRVLPFSTQLGETPQWIDVLADGRNELHDHLLSKDIETRKFWHPISSQAPYATSLQKFPASAVISANGLWLPSALTLEDEHILAVCEEVRNWDSQRQRAP